MADMLDPGVPDEVVVGLDAHAGRLGLSRSEYVRRGLAQDAARLTASPGAAEWAGRIERGRPRSAPVGVAQR